MGSICNTWFTCWSSAGSFFTLHIVLTISDFFSLFVYSLTLMILYILMESDRAVQQRQPAENNEQREQVRGAEANRNGGEGRRQIEENQNHCVPENTNYPTENNERVRCLSSFFCISVLDKPSKIEFDNMLYISYSNVSLYLYWATPRVILTKCCFVNRVLKGQVKVEKEVIWTSQKIILRLSCNLSI